MRPMLVAVIAATAAAMVMGGCKKKEPPQESVTVVVPPAVNAPLMDKGAAVFTAKCAACHKVNGAGGEIGPDLSKLGSQRDAMYIQTQLQDPKAYKPDSKMPSFKDLPKEDKDALVAYLLSLK